MAGPQKTGKWLYCNGTEVLRLPSCSGNSQRSSSTGHKWISQQKLGRLPLIRPEFYLLFYECVNTWFYFLDSEELGSYLVLSLML